MTNRTSMLATAATLIGVAACATDEGARPTARVELVAPATIYIETRAKFDGTPLFEAFDVHAPTSISVELAGNITFSDGTRAVDVSIARDGAVVLPAILAGDADATATLTVTTPEGPSVAVPIDVVAPGITTEILAQLESDAGVLASGPGFLVLDVSRIAVSDEGVSDSDDGSALGICWCPFVGRIGQLTVDASCRNRLAMWVIPEYGAAAFTPATARTKYDADGFKISSAIYKIDGSTCNTLVCGATTWSVNSCVNNIAALAGKRPPYWVPSGTFGNEPPANTPAQYVR